MNRKFETQYFSLTNNSILLLRNRFPYREIQSSDINKIELTKGTDVKRPLLSMLFGCTLFAAFLFLILNFSFLEFTADDFTGGRAARSWGYLIVGALFFLSFGAYSIYRALPFHWVIKFTLVSGEMESLSINEVIKSKTTESLVGELKKIVETNKILVSRELGL